MRCSSNLELGMAMGSTSTIIRNVSLPMHRPQQGYDWTFDLDLRLGHRRQRDSATTRYPVSLSVRSHSAQTHKRTNTRQSPPARPAHPWVHLRPAVPHPPVSRHLVSLPCTSRPAACRLSRTRDLPALRDMISRGECHAHAPYLRRTPHLSESEQPDDAQDP
ncbi:hypothetical protein FIBSPDRAFT_268296 [Athelia psychrophila]|uniref:Uncharacterized protein n=1 Tax=Athelia psychrophila TaxID=1759441 RepID=A0A166RI27_9AGAM|nr:hypothetical protein FIBSPDRAFT_268296 [Fibularhizoctonia sp. CBS 109695]